MSELLKKEIQFHEDRGYVMVSNEHGQALLEKLVNPTLIFRCGLVSAHWLPMHR